MIKKKYEGVGPSHATINHYVVNLGLIGVSPLKTSPKGNIPLPDYKALYAAFASYMRIEQLNNRQGTTK
jgi:hypothetical protein